LELDRGWNDQLRQTRAHLRDPDVGRVEREKKPSREEKRAGREWGGDAGRGRLELGGAVKRGAHRFARDAQAERV